MVLTFPGYKTSLNGGGAGTQIGTERRVHEGTLFTDGSLLRCMSSYFSVI